MKPPLSFKLSEDKRLLWVTPATSEPFPVNALSLEDLTRVLIASRASMEPRRTATDPFMGTQAITDPNMRWYVVGQDAPDGTPSVAVFLSHPGLGWMGMPLSRAGAEEMIAALTRNLPALR